MLEAYNLHRGFIEDELKIIEYLNESKYSVESLYFNSGNISFH